MTELNKLFGVLTTDLPRILLVDRSTNQMSKLMGVTLADYGSARGDRGVFGGGYTGAAYQNVIEYITISTTGNTTDFGDLVANRDRHAGCASSVRGIFGGGGVNVIQYITIATPGNAADFGDLLNTSSFCSCAVSSDTRGVFAGGYAGSGAHSNVIQYITMATTGNATDFGDVVSDTKDCRAPACSTTRGLFAGSSDGPGISPYTNIIDYITISTPGNSTDFGDLYGVIGSVAGCSSDTRGVFAGGYSAHGHVKYISYVTISTTGNASFVGDLSNPARFVVVGASSLIRAVFSGGWGLSATNIIEYVTIATLGGATDFGDLSTARCRHAGISNCHGGLA